MPATIGAANAMIAAAPATANGARPAKRRGDGRTNRPLKGTGKRPVKVTGKRTAKRTDTSHAATRKRTDDRRDQGGSPTRSGIQYPSRKTRRPRAEAEPASRSTTRRPVLRTVKGAPAPPARKTRTRAPAKSGTTAVPRTRRRRTEAGDELARIAGRNASRAQADLARAAEAYTSGRERDAARILRPLRDAYPDAAAVRELLGLVHYRLGQYPAALRELTAFVDLTGSVEQHPVLMDSWRAQRHYDKVEELWEELAQSSPSGALVTEGRIVLAGAQADDGRVQEAIQTLARKADDMKRVQEFHLRLWYALADLYERAGEIPRAREYFLRVRQRDASFADVAERLAALG